ncbi:MAG: transcriptional repressor [Bacteroidia bacterium]|nr:transcriptional repressor [Bacteroidia bacterium]
MTAADILSNHHLRKTPARLAIVQHLLSSNFPQSESEIREKMQDAYDRITFYRSIQVLMETGIVHRIIADNITVRYALNQCTQHLHEHFNDHVHFYCKQCGSVECLKDIAIGSYPLPEGYQKEECDVVIKGLCRNCSEIN